MYVIKNDGFLDTKTLISSSQTGGAHLIHKHIVLTHKAIRISPFLQTSISVDSFCRDMLNRHVNKPDSPPSSLKHQMRIYFFFNNSVPCLQQLSVLTARKVAVHDLLQL